MKYLQNVKQLNSLANQLYASASVGKVDSFPEDITVAVSSRCNYKCIMCAEWRRKQIDLPPETIEKLGDILPFARTLYVTGGEPLMYPHLDMLFETAQRAECGLTMVTNGSLLTDRNIERILKNGLFRVKFSLDAATQKTYAKIRGGNLEKVLRNISRLAEVKRVNNIDWPLLEVGFVAMRSNILELPKFVAKAASVGINHINVSYCVAHVEEMIPESLYFMQSEADHLMTVAKDVAEKVGVSIALPNSLFKGPAGAACSASGAACSSSGADCSSDGRGLEVCDAPWRSMFLWPEGILSMCCGGGGGTGNLNDASFPEVWNHKNRVAARKLINTKHPPAQCLSCFTRRQNPNVMSTLFSGKLKKIAKEYMADEVVPEPTLTASPASNAV